MYNKNLYRFFCYLDEAFFLCLNLFFVCLKMPRLRIKALTWLMSISVFVWFILTLFSETDDCTYDLDDRYYFEDHQEVVVELKNGAVKQKPASVYGSNSLVDNEPIQDLVNSHFLIFRIKNSISSYFIQNYT